MKTRILLMAAGVLSLALFSFKSGETTPKKQTSSITLLSNGNYVMTDIAFSASDEAALAKLQTYVPITAMGFFWSCYSPCAAKFTHGRIWGSGCCTSGPPTGCPASDLAMAKRVKGQVDLIMQKYMP